jgi:hypothetical protein
VVNLDQQSKNAKKTRQLIYNVGMENISKDEERPNSARTAITGANTVAQTALSSKTGGMSLDLTKQAALDALENLRKKDSRLSEYLKYDSALSRDQEIEMGRVSSLGDTEVMKIEGGVLLKQFGPQKRIDGGKKDKTNNDGEEVASDSERGLNFEAKMEKRRKEIEENKYEAPQVIFSKDGGKFSFKNCISKKEYFTKFGDYGTIG